MLVLKRARTTGQIRGSSRILPLAKLRGFANVLCVGRDAVKKRESNGHTAGRVEPAGVRQVPEIESPGAACPARGT